MSDENPIHILNIHAVAACQSWRVGLIDQCQDRAINWELAQGCSQDAVCYLVQFEFLVQFPTDPN